MQRVLTNAAAPIGRNCVISINLEQLPIEEILTRDTLLGELRSRLAR
jgi:hypothetical protein